MTQGSIARAAPEPHGRKARVQSHGGNCVGTREHHPHPSELLAGHAGSVVLRTLLVGVSTFYDKDGSE